MKTNEKSVAAAPTMITIIAMESQTATEYSRRIEAFNAGLARQFTDRELVKPFIPKYQAWTDCSKSAAAAHLIALISKARFERLEQTNKRFKGLIKNINKDVES